MEHVDCIVIGAGVIGLAIARELSITGREVLILEAEDSIGTHTSSRNTGCIHAGISYPLGSLKNRLCQRGKQLLYRYCPERNIGHNRCGKLLVANDDQQISRLRKQLERAKSNGLLDLRPLDAGEVRELEPELIFQEVVLSPSSGVVDQHDLMNALLGDAQNSSAQLVLNSPVIGGMITDRGIQLDVGGKDPISVHCKVCVNAAGHNATEVSKSIIGLDAELIPNVVFAKGNYFALTSKKPFKRLIYPVPDENGLSIHVSPDMSGSIRFGPDTEFTTSIDYTVDPKRVGPFYEGIRKFWPALQDGDLEPGYAGIRPKLSEARATSLDFLIQGPQMHGIPGLICLYGLESPGLTSSMAIGEYICEILV